MTHLLLIFFPSVPKVSHSGRRSSRLKNNLSLVVINPSQDYEIMSKESGAPHCSTSSTLSQADALCSTALCGKTSPLPSPTFTPLLPVEDTAHVETVAPISAVRSKQEEKECEGGVAEQRDSTEKHQLTGDSDSGIRAADDQGEEAQAIGRYEYMDIRRSNSTEGEGDPAWERRGSQKSVNSAAESEETDQIVEVLKKEHVEEEEEEKHHNTNKQPALMGNVSSMVMPGPDVLTAGGETVEEYEEMTRLGVVPNGWEQADYQNLPVKGRVVSEETGSGRCAGIGGYIKVCAGMGEPGSNTSFDNPDYWHSRLFLKPDAVRT